VDHEQLRSELHREPAREEALHRDDAGEWTYGVDRQREPEDAEDEECF
jgi:hypothetical protein